MPGYLRASSTALRGRNSGVASPCNAPSRTLEVTLAAGEPAPVIVESKQPDLTSRQAKSGGSRSVRLAQRARFEAMKRDGRDSFYSPAASETLIRKSLIRGIPFVASR